MDRCKAEMARVSEESQKRMLFFKQIVRLEPVLFCTRGRTFFLCRVEVRDTSTGDNGEVVGVISALDIVQLGHSSMAAFKTFTRDVSGISDFKKIEMGTTEDSTGFKPCKYS